MMTEETYTPGPWHLVCICGDGVTTISTVNPEGRSDKEVDEGSVLSCSEWISVSEQDARLMAAAPELLEALRDAMECLEMENPLAYKMQISKAKAAISKAQGEK